jgi:hypothetical protein
MTRFALLALAALAAAPAAATELTTPPQHPHPYPMGVPYLVEPAVVQPVIQLRYGILDGRRVLFDPTTMRVVYVLQP